MIAFPVPSRLDPITVVSAASLARSQGPSRGPTEARDHEQSVKAVAETTTDHWVIHDVSVLKVAFSIALNDAVLQTAGPPLLEAPVHDRQGFELGEVGEHSSVRT